MKPTKQKISTDQNGMALIIEIIVITVVLLLIGVVGYVAYQAIARHSTSSSDSSQQQANAAFGKDVDLALKQTATFGSGNDTIKFRFTDIKSPANIHAQCTELCTDILPTLMAELEYAGKTFKGTSSYGTGHLDMSYDENGAYPLVPYNIYIADLDYAKHSGTVEITEKKFTKIEPNKQFTLGNDGVAALVPGKTGVHVGFGDCGRKSDTPCMNDIDFYVNDKYADMVPQWFADPYASPELQYASKDGSYIDYDGIRLRLIESDDETRATFVLEKI